MDQCIGDATMVHIIAADFRSCSFSVSGIEIAMQVDRRTHVYTMMSVKV